MPRTLLALSLLLVLAACDGEPAPTKPTADVARPAEPVKAAEPAAPPAPVVPPKPAFLSQPERLNARGEPFADHERRNVDLNGLTRRGSEAAKVKIMACIDMRDIFSRRGQQSIAEVFAAFPNDLALYLRPYWNILDSAAMAAKKGSKPAKEQNALTKLLAQALVAAEQQGKIWEMHDRMLAAEKEQYTRDGLAAMAAAAGLDVETWKAALDSKATEDAVAEHKKACNALGVDKGTPANFVNGRLMLGMVKADDVRYLVEVEIAGGFEVLPRP